jgi:hypothetical protein
MIYISYPPILILVNGGEVLISSSSILDSRTISAPPLLIALYQSSPDFNSSSVQKVWFKITLSAIFASISGLFSSRMTNNKSNLESKESGSPMFLAAD